MMLRRFKRLTSMLFSQEVGSSLLGWGLRIGGAGFGFFTFRELFKAVGSDGVSAIAILQSIGAWFSVLEVGSGFLAQNHIVKARVGRMDGRAGLVTLICRPLVLIAVSAVLLVVFRRPWASFVANGEAATALMGNIDLVLISSIVFLGSAVSGMSTRILYAEGRNTMANAIPACSSVATFVTVWFLRVSGESELLPYVLAMGGPIALLSCLVLLWSLRVARCESSRNRELAQLGAPPLMAHRDYFLFNVASSLVLRVDIYVLSQILSAESLALYVSMQKIFALIFIGPQTLFSVVHAKFSALGLEGRVDALCREALRYALVPALVFPVFAVLMLFFDSTVAKLMTAGRLEAFGFSIVFWGCIYYVLRVWTDSWATALLATGKAGSILLPTLFQGLLSAPLLYFCGGGWALRGAMLR
jgi:hypothetical protein